ncbi:MAG TPA: AAA family ATPase [Rubrivivax sp.]
MAEALVVAVLGAESTGKTTLAAALATRLARETGLAVTWVPEWLRSWCDAAGRTPRADEQATIARTQHDHIVAAAASHEVVICDTTALMTAVYSQLLFHDRSLDTLALSLHRRVDLSLLTALDLPWVADGHQRDGAHVRTPVDTAVRELLIEHRLPWALVSGSGAQRIESALDAVAPLLRDRPAPRRGLFTRLAQRNADAPDRPWVCEHCDAPECEHAALQRDRSARRGKLS